MKHLITFITVLIISMNVHSGEHSIHYGVYTKHFRTLNHYEYNEKNDLLVYQYDDYMVGTFRNSFYTRSTLIGYRFLQTTPVDIWIFGANHYPEQYTPTVYKDKAIGFAFTSEVPITKRIGVRFNLLWDVGILSIHYKFGDVKTEPFKFKHTRPSFKYKKR